MSRLALVSLSTIVGLVGGANNLGAEEEEVRERWEARAIAMGTSHPPVVPRGRVTTLQININRWTTPEEREALFKELKENGQQGLVRSLQRQDETGWIRVTGAGAGATQRPREVFRYSRQMDLGEGKRRIVLALDRPISFTEQANRPRSRDFDVTLIVMDVDAENSGEGQLSIGVRLELNPDGELSITNFGSEPVRLSNLRQR